jgi:hypothetical protein
VVYDKYLQQLEIAEYSSWAAAARAGGTVHQDRRQGPSITVQITNAGTLSSIYVGQDTVLDQLSTAFGLCGPLSKNRGTGLYSMNKICL